MTVSTRRGSWIFNRVAEGGMPYDTKLLTRLYDYAMDKLPWTVLNDFMEYRLQVEAHLYRVFLNILSFYSHIFENRVRV